MKLYVVPPKKTNQRHYKSKSEILSTSKLIPFRPRIEAYSSMIPGSIQIVQGSNPYTINNNHIEYHMNNHYHHHHHSHHNKTSKSIHYNSPSHLSPTKRKRKKHRTHHKTSSDTHYNRQHRNQYDISSNHYPPKLQIIHRKKKKKHKNVPNHINIHYKSNRPKINIHNNSLNQQYGSSITSPTTQFTVRSPPTIHHIQTPPKTPKTAKSISYHSSHPTSPNVENQYDISS